MQNATLKNQKAEERMLPHEALDILFREARTFNSWAKKDVPDSLIKTLYDLTKMGSTSANCSPARFVFVKSEEARQRLKPHLDAGNVDKTMSAPVTVLIAQDMKFYEKLPKLFPHANARAWFEGNDAKIKETAFRNATLQGAYMMIAARSLGLDCGPMSGFSAKGVRDEFFKGRDVEVNFLCNIGYGTPDGLYPRSPRLNFEEASEIV